MIKLGEIQSLKILRKAPVGLYLNDRDDKDDDILLPRKYITDDMNIDDYIEVFVYRDSEDRMIATTDMPKITIGKCEKLEVVETTKIGAFLDWGLQKDLLLPFSEQIIEPKEGEKYLVALYIDKSDRLCATMDVYNYLESDSNYKENFRVRGTIYNTQNDLGVLVAVDNKYHGLIPKKEVYGDYNYGEEIEARVTMVREDGKLILSTREKSYMQMDKDAVYILDKLEKNNGILMLSDKSSPIDIKKELNMSKAAFKRAIGRLFKGKKIIIEKDSISLIKN